MKVMAVIAIAFAALGISTIAPFAQQAAPPTSASPSAPSPTAGTPPAGQVTAHVWKVDDVQCASLLAAADDDRASAAMFYYGYIAARSGIRVIDTNKISDNLAKVMKQCEATPNMTVPRAFRAALAKRK